MQDQGGWHPFPFSLIITRHQHSCLKINKLYLNFLCASYLECWKKYRYRYLCMPVLYPLYMYFIKANCSCFTKQSIVISLVNLQYDAKNWLSATYFSLLNLSDCTIAGWACRKFHKWIKSSPHWLTRAPCIQAKVTQKFAFSLKTLHFFSSISCRQEMKTQHLSWDKQYYKNKL